MTVQSPASHRSFVWLILIAALAAGIGLWLGSRQFGGTLTPADWQGHWNVVYFGYTSCPDVCPTALAEFKQAWKLLGERGLQAQVRFDFMSVDPQRDTPAKLASYVAFFSPDFVAATGSDEQLTALTRALGMIYSRTTRPDGTIEVDHSGSAVIVDPQGRVAGLFRPPFAARQVAADLAALAAGG
jgi:protein SCO1/2